MVLTKASAQRNGFNKGFITEEWFNKGFRTEEWF